ncbi:alpha/beta fold hydrolase [Dyella mobilis]|uniref:Alpha/beta hydrolase n=1 Tax=Dyella mobilis TaxID=1849582 RepID=A0ABS2KCD8_9GAMM|nr:alpha/beta hydrolase [Dyella mobilis]MBM7128842.1 alpha/beta hydrolase [Dyella mobilis]GLQ99173.1 arylesterase [Dyella mobilis]
MSKLDVEVDTLDRHVELFYEDAGYGFPVVLSHGWPFDHGTWEEQRAALLDKGCRVITYDRRGFGASSRPQGSYDYNRFADDLAVLLQHLDLRDVTLVGFSMGVGEIVRYMVRHLGQRVSRLALVSSIVPSLRRSADNADGLDELVFLRMAADIRSDRYEFASRFTDLLFEGDRESTVSEAQKRWIQSQINDASTEALLACIQLFQEADFTSELQNIHVPTLVVHGTGDRIAPIAATGARLAQMLPVCVYEAYQDAPHGLFATHAEQLSANLLELVRTPPTVTLPAATA